MNFESISITDILVGLTCVVSYISLQNQVARARLIFHPVTIRERQQWYRFLTSGFVHADLTHLLINMFVLWSFGNAIETYFYPSFIGEFSAEKYLALYLGGIVVSSIPSYLRHNKDPGYAALGASGGVSAVVFAAILFEPWQNLYLYGVIAIPQILAGAAYLYYSWYKDKNSNDNIGHMAHFSGAVWGFMFSGLLNAELFSRFLQKTLQGPAWF